METPSFYAIIPAHVRYCKGLEPNAKLLYGEITALCTSEGYCWASNQYFADLYEVDVSSVKRWITSLKDNNFIKVDIESQGIKRTRKIWLSQEIKKMFTTAQKRATPQLKNEPCINTSSITEERGEEAQAPPPHFYFYHKVKMEFTDLYALVEDFGRDKVDEMLDRLNEYSKINPKRFKQYACHATVIRKWIREDGQKKITSKPAALPVGAKSTGEVEADNRFWSSTMEPILRPYIQTGMIHIGSSGWEFNREKKLPIKVHYNDLDFIRKCNTALKDLGIMV